MRRYDWKSRNFRLKKFSTSRFRLKLFNINDYDLSQNIPLWNLVLESDGINWLQKAIENPTK